MTTPKSCTDRCVYHLEDYQDGIYVCGCQYAFNNDIEGTHEDILLWHQHKLSCPQMRREYHRHRDELPCRWHKYPVETTTPRRRATR